MGIIIPKTIPALVLLLALISMLVTIQVFVARANPDIIPPMPEAPDLNEPSITIQLPANKTYNVNTITYSISVKKPSSWLDFNPVHGTIMDIDYILDGNQHVEIANDPAYFEQGPFIYDGTLHSLSEGNHSIEVYVRSDSFYDPPDKPRPQQWPLGKAPPQDYYLDTYSGKVYFSIDVTPPTISILSSENKMYLTSEVPFSFTVDEPISQVMYCLDDSNNVTVAGNCTLRLSNGSHNLKVYAWDTAGNLGESETIALTVGMQTEFTSQPEPFPTVTVAAATGASASAVAVGVLVYFKRRKR
jgi:hypothetical protein